MLEVYFVSWKPSGGLLICNNRLNNKPRLKLSFILRKNSFLMFYLQYAGGVFCKLEAQWRAAYMQQQAKQQAQAQVIFHFEKK